MADLPEIDIAIVGGGILGCIIACKLVEKGYEPVVFEKSDTLVDAQSAHNSGVIHSGVYYAEGSVKADLCVRGNRIMYERCTAEGIATNNVKKLIVATTPAQEEILECLKKRGEANGVEGLKIISGKDVQRLEPNVHTTAALFVPSTGIVDGARYAKIWSERAKARAHVMPEAEVTSIEPEQNRDSFIVSVMYQNQARYGNEEGMKFRTRALVNAAGLGAGDIAQMVNPEFEFAVKARLGDYCQFNRNTRPELHTSGMCIYPTPVIERGVVATLGVHTTPEFGPEPPRLSNSISIGPTSKKVPVLDDFKEYQAYRIPHSEFLEAVQAWYPHLTEKDLYPGQYGVQVRIEAKQGGVYRDFVFGADTLHPNAFHAIMPSPGFTSAEPAADDLAEMVHDVLSS
jgi:L-2-hydroxyglutarate oxidase LhgO